MTSAYSEILQRIEAAIGDARAIFARFTPGAIDAEFKAGHDPVTEADRAIDAVLPQNLLREGDDTLSEEAWMTSRASKNRMSGSSIPSMERANL
jgi:3'-phosphoadenosine 5'-phosphosulfate (PAPS) 3'-phosphatase